MEARGITKSTPIEVKHISPAAHLPSETKNITIAMSAQSLRDLVKTGPFLLPSINVHRISDYCYFCDLYATSLKYSDKQLYRESHWVLITEPLAASPKWAALASEFRYAYIR